MRTINLLALCAWTAVSLAAAEQSGQIMSHSADFGWNLLAQVTTAVEPPLKNQEIALDGGIKTDGSLNKVHRYVVDKVNHAYFGYDLVFVESSPDSRRHRVAIRPLTIVPQEAGFDGGTVRNPVGLSKFPDHQEVEDGDSIVLDLFATPAGQKVVDFIRISARTDLTPANISLVPQDFTVDDGPIAIKLPFTILVNGRKVGAGWAFQHGSTMWLAIPGRGGFVLSLVPRAGYKFQKTGAIRNHAITFQWGGNDYEIRTSGPIAGSNKAWNLYVLHLPEWEPKGPLFGVDRLEKVTEPFQ